MMNETGNYRPDAALALHLLLPDQAVLDQRRPVGVPRDRRAEPGPDPVHPGLRDIPRRGASVPGHLARPAPDGHARMAPQPHSPAQRSLSSSARTPPAISRSSRAATTS